MKILRIFFTICFCVTTASLFAQSRHYNSQTLGMGGGGTAYIDGYHSNFLNPANLMLNKARRPSTSIGIIGGIGVKAGGSLLNLKVYDDYFTKGLTLEGQIREDMLNDWFGANATNTRNIAVSLDIVPLGFSKKGQKSAFSFANRVRVVEDFTINKGFAELAFYGLDSDQFGTAVPVNFNNKTISYAEFSIGYAREIPLPLQGIIESVPFINGVKLYAGVAPKYIVAAQGVELDFNSTLQVQPAAQAGGITQTFDYSLYSFGDLSKQLKSYADARQTNPDAKLDDYLDYSGSDVGTVGSGFGMDLGVTAEIDVSIPALGLLGKRQVLRVAMSATDLGTVNFDSSPSRVTANGAITFDGDAGDDSFEDYLDNFADSLENDVYGDFVSESVGAKKYKLPGMYNFGAALTLGKLTTTLDYGFGFNDIGTNTKRSSLTLGTEYRLLGFIPIRLGTRLGGYSSRTYSAGFGVDLKVLEFTFAAQSVANTTEFGSSAAFAWSGLLIRF